LNTRLGLSLSNRHDNATTDTTPTIETQLRTLIRNRNGKDIALVDAAHRQLDDGRTHVL
jgi:hypothetical protein